MFLNLIVMFSRQSGPFFREENDIFKENWAESEKFLLDFIYKNIYSLSADFDMIFLENDVFLTEKWS